MIGLVDAEVLKDGRKFIPNLEIMKLYSYYKKIGEYPKLLSSAENIYACNKLFIYQEERESEVDEEFWDHPNITTGGLYFTGGKYKPFSDVEIENASPNYRAYSDYIKYRLNATIFKRSIPNIIALMNAGFIRLHSSGRLQMEQVKEKELLWIYDDDVLANDGFDKLEAVMARKPSRIYYTCPMMVDSLSTLDKIIEKNIFTGGATDTMLQHLALNFEIPVNHFQQICSWYDSFFHKVPSYNIELCVFPPNYNPQYITKSQEINLMRATMWNYYKAIQDGYIVSVYHNYDKRYYFNQLAYKFSQYTNDNRRVFDRSFFNFTGARKDDNMYNQIVEMCNYHKDLWQFVTEPSRKSHKRK